MLATRSKRRCALVCATFRRHSSADSFIVFAFYGYSERAFPFLLVAAGAGPRFTLLNMAGLAAVPAQRPGQATGMIYMFRFGGGAIGVAASVLHGALFESFLIPRLSKYSLSSAQLGFLEQPGAAERIGHIDSGLLASQIEQVRQAFHDSFNAAFIGTLRLSMLLPIGIALLGGAGRYAADREGRRRCGLLYAAQGRRAEKQRRPWIQERASPADARNVRRTEGLEGATRGP